ncbi:Palmitoyltransferase zdhhc2, partial [Xenoophorus captivus]
AGGRAHFRLKEYLKGLPDTQAKFHILFLFFSASMFSISLASLFIYHCWLVCKNRSTLEAVRAPVFRHGTDKNGFSLGFTKNFLQVFGDEAKYWPVPIFSSLGDGCSFPTCLVNLDPEQPSSPSGSSSASKSAGEGRQFPSKPLRESQSRLLTTTPSWSENEGAGDKDKKGKIMICCLRCPPPCLCLSEHGIMVVTSLSFAIMQPAPASLTWLDRQAVHRNHEFPHELSWNMLLLSESQVDGKMEIAFQSSAFL